MILDELINCCLLSVHVTVKEEQVICELDCKKTVLLPTFLFTLHVSFDRCRRKTRNWMVFNNWLTLYLELRHSVQEHLDCGLSGLPYA